MRSCRPDVRGNCIGSLEQAAKAEIGRLADALWQARDLEMHRGRDSKELSAF